VPYRRGTSDTVSPGIDTNADVYSIFCYVDKDANGYISEHELGAALVNGDFTQFDPETIKLMMRMFDVDRSSTIGFEEFTGLWNYLSKWKKLFNDFDTDQSGRISLEEFSNALYSFGYRLTPEFVEYLFMKSIRQGQWEISFDKFVRSCIELKQATQTFRKYDVNRTGYISLSFEDFIREVHKQ